MCKMFGYLLFASCFSTFGACVNNLFGTKIFSVPVFVLQKFVVISCTTRSELCARKTNMDNFNSDFFPVNNNLSPFDVGLTISSQILYASFFISSLMNTQLQFQIFNIVDFRC